MNERSFRTTEVRNASNAGLLAELAYRNIKTYTREQVEAAVNDGANMAPIAREMDMDRANLIVNAQLTLLDQPDASLDDVILSNWQADEEDYEEAAVAYDGHQLTEQEGAAVDAALVAKVRGWSE